MTLTYDPTFFSTPPPGFREPPRMVISPGTWRRVGLTRAGTLIGLAVAQSGEAALPPGSWQRSVNKAKMEASVLCRRARRYRGGGIGEAYRWRADRSSTSRTSPKDRPTTVR